MPRWKMDDDAILRRMWMMGKPIREIADAIGRGKNSVLGRAHRMGLPMHQDAANYRRKEAIWRKEYATHRTCQWIEGDPRGEHTKCGERVKQGSHFAFCDEHHERAFKKPVPKEEREEFQWKGPM